MRESKGTWEGFKREKGRGKWYNYNFKNTIKFITTL